MRLANEFIRLPYIFDVQKLTENYNAPLVMHPGEIDALIADIVFDMRAYRGNPELPAQAFENAMHDFRHEWRRL